jgi:hypothetical protein
MATTTSIFRLNFESYPELRTELRTKAVSKIFDQMSVTQRDGDGTDSCKLTRATWVKDTLAEWDEVDADYVPEEHAALVQMTDSERARKIVAFEKRATAGAAKLAAKAELKLTKAAEKIATKVAKKLAKSEANVAKKLANAEAKAQAKATKAEAKARAKATKAEAKAHAKATKATEKEELKAARAVVKAEANAIHAIKAAKKQANMTHTTVSHGTDDSMDGGDSSESELEPESEVDELVFEMNYLAVVDDESTVVPIPTTAATTATGGVPSMSKSEKKEARIAERVEKLIARTELKEARDAQKEVVRRAKSDAKLAKASAKQRRVKPTDANNTEDDIDVYDCTRRAAAGVCVSNIGAPARRQIASRYLSARACLDVTTQSVSVDDFIASNDGIEFWTDIMIADWNVTGAKFVPAPYHTYLD